MKSAPLCPACGAFVQERRTFSDDGPVIVAHVCDCGHVSSFSLTFENSRSRASAAPVGSSRELSPASSTVPGAFSAEAA